MWRSKFSVLEKPCNKTVRHKIGILKNKERGMKSNSHKRQLFIKDEREVFLDKLNINVEEKFKFQQLKGSSFNP